MAYPREFRDDGEALFLDVHGCTVPEAMELVTRAVEEGGRRGRSRLEVVHGYSTSNTRHDATIKNALADALHEGAFIRYVSGGRWDESGGRCTLVFQLGAPRRRDRIRVQDLTRR